MYHPNLEDDIRESASKFQMAVGPAAPAVGPAAPAVRPVAGLTGLTGPTGPTAPAKPKPEGAPVYTMQEFRGKQYRMKFIRPEPKAVATGFEIYASDDVKMTKLLGKSGVKLPTEFGKEKPGKPVEFF